MHKEVYQFKKIDDNETELLIYGDIRKMDFWDMYFGDNPTRIDSYSFKEALDKIDTSNLTVRINSLGGSVSEGLAIYNLLNSFKGKVKTIVDGFACSAASVIFMAGSERIVPESGLLLIHNAWSFAEGDSNAMKKAAEDLEKITQPSINIYLSKTKLTEDEIKAKMDYETWITSQEAFDWGFSTSMVKDDPKQSLESHYLYNLVMKLKNFENKEVIELKTYAGNKLLATEIIEEKKDAWSSFFNN